MILLLGHTGFLGKRVGQALDKAGIEWKGASLTTGVDLRDANAFDTYLESHGYCNTIINCASYSGGLGFAMSNPVPMYENNMQMIMNIYKIAQKHGIGNIINPISNCVYPAKATLFKEEELWDGALHETVYMYGFTRRAEIALSWAYQKQYGMNSLNLVMSNMYGEGDHFDLKRSHALGALVMRFMEAKRNNHPSVTVLGTGKPVREWLYVGDAADAIVQALRFLPRHDLINVGVGHGVTMTELINRIAKACEYEGDIVYDTNAPDGAPHKTVDGTRGEEILGFLPSTTLEEGLARTIAWYKENK